MAMRTYFPFFNLRKGLKFVVKTGASIDAHPAAGGAGLKIHTHSNTTEWGNEFKGEFVNTSGTMDGIQATFRLHATGSGVMRAIYGSAELDSGYTLNGTAATGSWLVGSFGSANVKGTLNGTAVHILGAYAGLGSMTGGILTACKHMAALMVDSQVTQAPTAGQFSLIYAHNGLGATLDQIMYIDPNDRATNLFKLYNCANMISADAATGAVKKIKINIDGNTYYINTYLIS